MQALPANYPIHIYSGSAGGQQRWQAGVCLPSFCAMRSCDHAAAASMHGETGWRQLVLAQVLQLVDARWVGIKSAVMTVTGEFLNTYF